MTLTNYFQKAHQLDQADPLKTYREQFHLPLHNGSPYIYFTGNSLGLQPKTVEKAIRNELEQWATLGVEGHFKGDLPWMYYHKFLAAQSAQVVGAKESEVVVMNTLTTNLHLMMVSFYRPNQKRFKIIMEAGAFPSDQYAMESQVKFHGFSPKEAIVEVAPRPGEDTLRPEDILQAIEEHADTVALVLFGGVNYYTGQFFPLKDITAAGHKVGAVVGFDLAHAAGNVPLALHDWGVDFAVWCSYKYLNSGPGGPSGAFVHERHGNNPELPRFAGWWGHDEGERFEMKKGFIPMKGAAGWQLSNAQIFSFAAHKASLDLFQEVGMDALRQKSLLQQAFLLEGIDLLNENGEAFEIITPKDPEQRGCQSSILAKNHGKLLFDYLMDNGVLVDWREPNVVRLAPVPLYNTFDEIARFIELLWKFEN